MSIRIDGTNTAANPGITGADADTGLQFGTDEVSIVTGGTDRVTVDGSGNVGISTSSPTSPLEVHSDIGTNIIAKSTNGNGGFLNYSGLASNGTTTFSVNHNGTIYTAGGLNFGSVTSPVTSQTLDDYEEGTWTPVISAGTVTINSSHYIKIGNIVHLSTLLQNFSNIGSTSQITIVGLPFTRRADTQAVSAVFYRYIDNGTYTQLAALMNTTSIVFYAMNPGTGAIYAPLNYQHLTSTTNSQLRFSMTYVTD